MPTQQPWENELEGVLKQAIAQLKEQPVPKLHAQQVLDRIEHWPQPRLIYRQKRRQFLALGGIAASIIFLLVWLLWPNDSWAQIVDAMHQKPWIRMTSEVSKTAHVNWFNLQRGISAWKSGDAVYHDARLKVIYRFDENAKTIFRLPEDDQARQLLSSANTFFAGIFQNKKTLDGALLGRIEITHQERQEITSAGKKVIEYSLQCRAKDQHDQRITMLVQVDPETHLAQRLTFKNLTPRNSNEPLELSFQIDYPEKGPLDIYDLGIAKETPFVDRIPPDDLQRIANSIKTNREVFDAYAGIVVHENRPFVRIWRKGTKWRIELCSSGPMSPPNEPAERHKWWLAKAKDVMGRAQEVCDGNYLYTPDRKNYMPHEVKIENAESRSMSFTYGMPEMEMGQARLFFPELIGYALVPLGSQHYSVTTMTHQEKGMEGTTLLHARLTQSTAHGGARLQRFWIDPLHGYMARRHDIAEWEGLPDRLVYRTIEKLNRTPSGIWYPEVIKGTHTNFQFYLDFNAPLPDELFTPKERTMKK